jgi:selenide, water dikinase
LGKVRPQGLKDLVLLGGGHSHAIALRHLISKRSRHPWAGVRLILLTEAPETAYSGMLPGHIAGFYRHGECHINLANLARAAGAELILDQAIGLDLATKQILCAQRSRVSFDLLSVDIGSTPQIPPGIDRQNTMAAKPVREFLAQWDDWLQELEQSPQQPVRLAIVGGGAGGVELALNLQRRLQDVLRSHAQPSPDLTIHLIHRGAQVLAQSNTKVSDRLHDLLRHRGIHLHLNETVDQVQSGVVYCASGLRLTCDRVVWVTQASAPLWLAESGLKTDANGFILVNDGLQSLSHPFVFATGDIATMVNHPRPKAGVFAVRQGKPLADNLQQVLQGHPLRPFHPQGRYLSLIGTGDRQAIALWNSGTQDRAGWGSLGWRSPLLWYWKEWLDRRFMAHLTRVSKDHAPIMRHLDADD